MIRPSKWILQWAAILLFVSPSLRGTDYDCTTLDDCIAKFPSIAKAKDQHVPAYANTKQEWIQKLDGFDGAIPKLVEMLADPDDDVANLAAEALRDADYIDPVFLPQVVAGLNRGLGWLPPALGRMQSDDAAREAVARYLVSESAPENQEAYAVKLAGKRAVPYILQSARCGNGCAQKDQYLLGAALREMDPAARAMAAPGLMAIASDYAVPRDVAGGALEMLSDLQEAGRLVEPELLTLREKRPDLSGAIDDALIGIRARSTGTIYANRLTRTPDVGMLVELAQVGSTGRDAGPVVEHLLQHNDAEIRLAAARALGRIGYAPSASKLIPLLDDPIDVRLDWAAADALGRLGNPVAVQALRRTSEQHWYPPVRIAAAASLEQVLGGKANANPVRDDGLSLHEIEYEYFDLDSCKNPLVARRDPAGIQKLYAGSDSHQIEKLSFDTEVLSYGPAEEPSARDGEKTRVIEVTPDNMVEHRTPTKQIPGVALRVADGWLVGSNRGEWGGELMYLGDNIAPQKIADENVEDIYQLGDRLIATAGLAHMGLNFGSILALVRRQDGTWSAKSWRRLPGAPMSSWFVDTGELLINTVGGGTILVAADGSMRMAPCSHSD